MNRVATFGNYQSALLDLMSAQARGADAQKRVSTQKTATDLTGFGRQSETLTAMKGAQSRIQGFLDTSNTVAARLTAQDLALMEINDGVSGLREAVANVLATDSAATLMQDLEGQFQAIRGALTMRHQGSYLFAGAATATVPLKVDSLSQLAAAPDVASVFANDTLKTVSRVAEGSTLETGFLADELGSEVLGILRDIQLYHQSANGPLTGKMSQTQKEYLTEKLGQLAEAATGVIDKTAKTGSMANQVESIAKAHQSQLISLDELVADRTDADMAVAITDLEMSQIAIQASAQVISQLRQVSLLNYLS